jgi:hypothetical protein
MLSENSTQFVFLSRFLYYSFQQFLIGLHIQARNGRLWWVEDTVWKYDVNLLGTIEY